MGIDYNNTLKAANDGKHHGTYVTLVGQSNQQLLRSIQSYTRNVAEHQIKINNPADFVSDWENRHDAYKAGIIKKWEKDIIRNNEQLNIARGIATERGLNYE